MNINGDHIEKGFSIYWLAANIEKNNIKCVKVYCIIYI